MGRELGTEYRASVQRSGTSNSCSEPRQRQDEITSQQPKYDSKECVKLEFYFADHCALLSAPNHHAHQRYVTDLATRCSLAARAAYCCCGAVGRAALQVHSGTTSAEDVRRTAALWVKRARARRRWPQAPREPPRGGARGHWARVRAWARARARARAQARRRRRAPRADASQLTTKKRSSALFMTPPSAKEARSNDDLADADAGAPVQRWRPAADYGSQHTPETIEQRTIRRATLRRGRRLERPVSDGTAIVAVATAAGRLHCSLQARELVAFARLRDAGDLSHGPRTGFSSRLTLDDTNCYKKTEPAKP